MSPRRRRRLLSDETDGGDGLHLLNSERGGSCWILQAGRLARSGKSSRLLRCSLRTNERYNNNNNFATINYVLRWPASQSASQQKVLPAAESWRKEYLSSARTHSATTGHRVRLALK